MMRLVTTFPAFLLCSSVWGAPFQNGSFELGAAFCRVFNLVAGSTIITGWTVSVGNIDWEGPPGPGAPTVTCGEWQASNGNNSLDLVGTGGIGGIQQTFDTVPGTTYQVSFDMAGNYGAPPTIKPLAVTINGATTNFTFDTAGKNFDNMGWATHTLTFVASSTTSTINFVSDVTPSGGTLNAGAALDNVQITVPGAAVSTAVPLSWTHYAAALLIALAAGLLLARRRRIS